VTITVPPEDMIKLQFIPSHYRTPKSLEMHLTLSSISLLVFRTAAC